jgi:dienelactone hydrolase
MPRMRRAILLAAATLAAVLSAQIPEHDARNVLTPDMDTHFYMPSYASADAWLNKAAFLRKQILASAGLLPFPEKTPLHAQIFGRIERNGYSVEKVLLETVPGFYLGGNLYRPLGKSGRFPGIITPHGHWTYGRLENTSQVSAPARCINFALQGFVVFSYDMVGYNDTNQFPHGDSGPHLGGPREDLWSINTMGLQLWNSIRAVDFITSLPDVDPSRIAATGASGGGTQTFLLMAVDDRIKVAAPVNMVSAIMQGNGCEEAPNLRVRAFNVMFAAMMAPRPLLMVSATGDWTRNTPKEEFPAVQRIYRLLGAEQNVESVQIDQRHNYSKESREAVYAFFNARLLGGSGPVKEQRFRVEQPPDLLALFDRDRPSNSVTMDEYTAARISEAQRNTEQLHPHDGESLGRSRHSFLERLTFSFLDERPASDEIISETSEQLADGELLFLGRAGKGDRVPAIYLHAPRAASAAAPTLIVHPEGLKWVRERSQDGAGLVKGILNAGGDVLGIDAFQTGSAKAPRDRKKRAFTVYNQTDDANRVQDILTAIAYLQNRTGAKTVNLVGLGMGGIWSYFARALAGRGVNLAADLNLFAVDNDQEYLQKFFVPGLRKAGDFRAAAVLDAEGSVLLYNAAPDFPAEWLKHTAEMSGTRAEVRHSGVTDSELLRWITGGAANTRKRGAGQ